MQNFPERREDGIDGMLVVLPNRKMLHPPKKVSAPYRVETFLKFK